MSLGLVACRLGGQKIKLPRRRRRGPIMQGRHGAGQRSGGDKRKLDGGRAEDCSCGGSSARIWQVPVVHRATPSSSSEDPYMYPRWVCMACHGACVPKPDSTQRSGAGPASQARRDQARHHGCYRWLAHTLCAQDIRCCLPSWCLAFRRQDD